MQLVVEESSGCEVKNLEGAGRKLVRHSSDELIVPPDDVEHFVIDGGRLSSDLRASAHEFDQVERRYTKLFTGPSKRSRRVV
jgi:hypothetical protein